MSPASRAIEAAIARLEAMPEGPARAAAREAISAILELHREGIARLLARVPDADRILAIAADDALVGSLLALHGLHPPPPAPETVRAEPGFVPIARLGARRAEHERCELCAEALAPDHDHLFDVERRKLSCACPACAVLFDSRQGKTRRVRRQARRLEDFRMTEAEWAALEVPVSLAFFARASASGAVIGAYPGPAGAVEAIVPRAAWDALCAANPALLALEDDIAALLVDRSCAAPGYYVVSIDECYRLTGAVRARWRGPTGGDGPVRAIEEFVGALAGGS